MNFLFIEPYCMSNSSFKSNKYYINESYLKSIINEINYEYDSNIQYNDIDVSELILFFRKISNKIEKDEDFFIIIENFKWFFKNFIFIDKNKENKLMIKQKNN